MCDVYVWACMCGHVCVGMCVCACAMINQMCVLCKVICAAHTVMSSLPMSSYVALPSCLQESNPAHFTDSVNHLPAVMTQDHMSYFLVCLNLAVGEQGMEGREGREGKGFELGGFGKYDCLKAQGKLLRLHTMCVYGCVYTVYVYMYQSDGPSYLI